MSHHSFESPDFIARFNQEQKWQLTEGAEVMRRSLISAAFQVFKESHVEDIATLERLNLTKKRLWLTVDDFDAPTLDGEPQETMAFAVQSGHDDQSRRRLRFHIPVPEDFDRESTEALDRLEQPNRLYVERVNLAAGIAGKTAVRYAIAESHAFMYRTFMDTQDEEVLYPDDDAVWDEFDRGFNSGITLVAELSEDLINWRRVKQRLLIHADDGSVEARDI